MLHCCYCWWWRWCCYCRRQRRGQQQGQGPKQNQHATKKNITEPTQPQHSHNNQSNHKHPQAITMPTRTTLHRLCSFWSWHYRACIGSRRQGQPQRDHPAKSPIYRRPVQATTRLVKVNPRPSEFVSAARNNNRTFSFGKHFHKSWHLQNHRHGTPHPGFTLSGGKVTCSASTVELLKLVTAERHYHGDSTATRRSACCHRAAFRNEVLPMRRAQPSMPKGNCDWRKCSSVVLWFSDRWKQHWIDHGLCKARLVPQN